VQQEEQQQAQAEQDQIVQETQDEIDRIPQMSDADLTGLAVDLGLVRRDPDPGPGPGGAEGLAGTGDDNPSGKDYSTSSKTRRPK
jgi:hypothetical protein